MISGGFHRVPGDGEDQLILLGSHLMNNFLRDFKKLAAEMTVSQGMEVFICSSINMLALALMTVDDEFVDDYLDGFANCVRERIEAHKAKLAERENGESG